MWEIKKGQMHNMLTAGSDRKIFFFTWVRQYNRISIKVVVIVSSFDATCLLEGTDSLYLCVYNRSFLKLVKEKSSTFLLCYLYVDRAKIPQTTINHIKALCILFLFLKKRHSEDHQTNYVFEYDIV